MVTIEIEGTYEAELVNAVMAAGKKAGVHEVTEVAPKGIQANCRLRLSIEAVSVDIFDTCRFISDELTKNLSNPDVRCLVDTEANIEGVDAVASITFTRSKK